MYCTKYCWFISPLSFCKPIMPPPRFYTYQLRNDSITKCLLQIHSPHCTSIALHIVSHFLPELRQIFLVCQILNDYRTRSYYTTATYVHTLLLTIAPIPIQSLYRLGLCQPNGLQVIYGRNPQLHYRGRWLLRYLCTLLILELQLITAPALPLYCSQLNLFPDSRMGVN